MEKIIALVFAAAITFTASYITSHGWLRRIRRNSRLRAVKYIIKDESQWGIEKKLFNKWWIRAIEKDMYAPVTFKTAKLAIAFISMHNLKKRIRRSTLKSYHGNAQATTNSIDNSLTSVES